MMALSISGAQPPQDPEKSTPAAQFPCAFTAGYQEAALCWFSFGFAVVPIVPGTKRPAVRWDPWLDDLSPVTIVSHWSAHPDHEIGCIVGDGLIVFDADSPASVAALRSLEREHGTQASLIVKTAKGEHHYLRRGSESFARSDAHSTEAFPDRIDVKTGRALIILPPSTGKSVLEAAAHSVSELTEARQEFIDALFQHNGRPAPRHRAIELGEGDPAVLSALNVRELEALLGHLDPDMGYDDWAHVGMAVWHETDGSDDGPTLLDRWSLRGAKYPGRRAIESKWRSFNRNVARPITGATIRKMVADQGVDWVAVVDALEPFDMCEGDATPAAGQLPGEPIRDPNPLDRHSLLGRADEIERLAVAQKPILGEIALSGQATAFYAAPNSGKTLITLSELIRTIARGGVDPSKVYYINCDDGSRGLAEKARIADEYGFHMLADGYQDFSAGKFLSIIREMIANNQARGIVVILDTIKKFTDLMDKKSVSDFTKVIRRFVLSGGTLIGLAHTNKNKRDGKPVYGGTSDLVDDFDCAYTLASLPPGDDPEEKIVVFENIKRRGNVVQTAAYSYTVADHIGYEELLASVRAVDEFQLEPLKQAAQVISDAVVIQAIETCIREGFNTKMRLADAVAARTSVSRRSAIQVVEKYTGEDSSKHRWTYSVQERGAKVFVLLDAAPPLPGTPVPLT